MIIGFYDKNFKGIKDNTSLTVDSSSYSLIKRGIELDELKCTCEAFTDDLQPTFAIVKDDMGRYVYGCLAGIPQLNEDNQTEITGTDLKTMFKSDVFLDISGDVSNIASIFNVVFLEWKNQVVQGSFNCELENDELILPDNLLPESGKKVYNAWEDIFAPYMKYYGLYMESRIDIQNKKIIFSIKKSMKNDLRIKLWEYGIKNYGKWIAEKNEAQGYVLNTETGESEAGIKWILTSNNSITTSESERDIFPIKKIIKLVEYSDASEKATSLDDANKEALLELTNSMFNENIELTGVNADFSTRFKIYAVKGGGLYKDLPCGELHYDASGLKKIQIGYRFTGLQFLI